MNRPFVCYKIKSLSASVNSLQMRNEFAVSGVISVFSPPVCNRGQVQQ
jgi:hypothetical protein